MKLIIKLIIKKGEVQSHVEVFLEVKSGELGVELLITQEQVAVQTEVVFIHLRVLH